MSGRRSGSKGEQDGVFKGESSRLWIEGNSKARGVGAMIASVGGWGGARASVFSSRAVNGGMLVWNRNKKREEKTTHGVEGCRVCVKQA
jgi:hypothetical protein